VLCVGSHWTEDEGIFVMKNLPANGQMPGILEQRHRELRKGGCRRNATG